MEIGSKLGPDLLRAFPFRKRGVVCLVMERWLLRSKFE